MTKTTTVKSVPLEQVINPWGGEERIQREVKNSLKYQVEKPDSFLCIKCGGKYQPKPYQTIYYNLCDVCFREFDAQKTAGRKATLNDSKRVIRHFEDVAEWIKQK